MNMAIVGQNILISNYRIQADEPSHPTLTGRNPKMIGALVGATVEQQPGPPIPLGHSIMIDWQ
jgi:hypothetical protein